jgi:Arc/MetJ-type ribon-helix-helix transcriptional regulator
MAAVGRVAWVGHGAKPLQSQPRLRPAAVKAATIATRVVMTVTLRPEHERAIAQAIQSGAYQSPDEVIGRALEVLLSEDEWLYGQRDKISEKIERAFGQFECGEFLSPTASRADMDRRKAEWLREQKR